MYLKNGFMKVVKVPQTSENKNSIFILMKFALFKKDWVKTMVQGLHYL